MRSEVRQIQAPPSTYGRAWAEIEYLLVLDSYLCHRSLPRHETSPHVLELVRLLGRTPASVVMRMENYASLDEERPGPRRGLVNAGAECHRLYHEWSRKPDELHSLAAVLRRDASERRSPTIFEPNPAPVPRAFERYELLELIGRGGFGDIYSCLDVDSGERRAIKILREDVAYDVESASRFAREIKLLKSVLHPHVIRIYEHNLDERSRGSAFVMDLAEENLSEYLEDRRAGLKGEVAPLRRAEAKKIFAAVALAASALHANVPGIIHRDINPFNILRMRDERWVLADFGLAKFLPAAQHPMSFATLTSTKLGTSHYASPEQYRDLAKCDERSDVYSLGVLLWELFSSHYPPPDSRDPGLPDDVRDIWIRATDRSPGKRYSSVLELAETVARLAE